MVYMSNLLKSQCEIKSKHLALSGRQQHDLLLMKGVNMPIKVIIFLHKLTLQMICTALH